ncbi:predicted protein [Plenodomus lingam JN3]|uniref:Predicted protein n=1 Tax=Leptosphaeria maculans (strain JN3 / isolate v23.1.3 / race Av1-4-5-6-7-8) TaxID=985895 RepID=E4ZNU2_LEPMJ|nr:predicted protein [Plenodomus lingam JN3]CBX93311.1 predicted protein [Plenodomus lingam JN3]
MSTSIPVHWQRSLVRLIRPNRLDRRMHFETTALDLLVDARTRVLRDDLVDVDVETAVVVEHGADEVFAGRERGSGCGRGGAGDGVCCSEQGEEDLWA